MKELKLCYMLLITKYSEYNAVQKNLKLKDKNTQMLRSIDEMSTSNCSRLRLFMKCSHKPNDV